MATRAVAPAALGDPEMGFETARTPHRRRGEIADIAAALDRLNRAPHPRRLFGRLMQDPLMLHSKAPFPPGMTQRLERLHAWCLALIHQRWLRMVPIPGFRPLHSIPRQATIPCPFGLVREISGMIRPEVGAFGRGG